VQQTLENKLPHRNDFWKRGKKTSRGRVFVSLTPTCNRLYRGFYNRQAAATPIVTRVAASCRFQIGDTAGWKPALRGFTNLLQTFDPPLTASRRHPAA
jgi:hypothetical protein